MRWLRKDNVVWDIAIVAVLLNALIQINCFMMPSVGPQGFFGYELSSWCSNAKTDSAATGQLGDESNGTQTCADCRQCSGQSIALIAETNQTTTTFFSLGTLSSLPPRITIKSTRTAIYDSRGPPTLLLI